MTEQDNSKTQEEIKNINGIVEEWEKRGFSLIAIDFCMSSDLMKAFTPAPNVNGN